MEAIINLTSTGLIFDDLTIDWCNRISDDFAVSQIDMELVERGNGFYKLTNPNITEDTDFYVYETATPENFAVGIFGIADGDIAQQSTLDTIMGGGFTNESLEELMVAVKTRLASKSYVVGGASPTGVTVSNGTVLSPGVEGDWVTLMSNVNQEYFKVQESGNFEIILDYDNNIDTPYTTFTFVGRYIGSTNHRVEIELWDYTLGDWVDVDVQPRDIPNTSQDTVIQFDVPDGDFYQGTGPYSAQIRITHEPATVAWHELWIDTMSFGEIERIYVPADNAGIQSANLGIVNESQRILSMVESQRGSHTGITNVYYWDPVGGDDANDGLTPDTAKLTYSHGVADGVHSLLTDSNHDVIIIYPGSPSGATEINEQIIIDTRYTFLRGPGRDAYVNWTGENSPAITLAAEGTELSGVRINTDQGTAPCLHITGDFAFVHDIWIDSSAGHGIFIDNANHCMINEFLIEDAATGGGADAIRVQGDGTGARRNLISDGRIINNNADGITITGANTGNNMIFGELAIQDNTGYGINDTATANSTIVIGPSISVANNNSGGDQMQLLGTGSTALNLNQYAEEATLANVQVIAQKAADAAFGTYQLDVPNSQLVLLNESSVEVARWDLTPDYVNPSGKTRV